MLQESISGIYRIVNLINGKSYVGQTCDFKDRKRRHFQNLEKGKVLNVST